MTIVETIKSIFDIEIAELLYVKDSITKSVEEAVMLIRDIPGKVVVTGIGKSGLIGKKISATLASTGTESVFLNSAEALHGDLGIVSKNDCVIIISNSGNGIELKNIIPVLNTQNIPIIAMTGNQNSYLAKHAKVCLNIHVRQEGCPLNLAPMSSSTATLVYGDALAATLMKLKNFKPENFALYHPGGALGRRLLLHVEDVMKKGEDIPILSKNATMDEVVIALTEKKIGAVCISDDGVHLDGLITEGDLRRALMKKSEFFSFKAQDVMIQNPITIQANCLAADALSVMEERDSQISVLPVIQGENCIKGILRIHDLIGQLK